MISFSISTVVVGARKKLSRAGEVKNSCGDLSTQGMEVARWLPILAKYLLKALAIEILSVNSQSLS